MDGVHVETVVYLLVIYLVSHSILSCFSVYHEFRYETICCTYTHGNSQTEPARICQLTVDADGSVCSGLGPRSKRFSCGVFSLQRIIVVKPELLVSR